jgi:hypothetical protein
MSKNKGLQPLHLGVVIDDRIMAPPSQFALARIGVWSQKDVKDNLEAVLDDLHSGRVDSADTPLLAHYAQMPQFSIEDLQAMVTVKEGTQKFIDWRALRPMNEKGDSFYFSHREQLIASVESRGTRDDQQPYAVHIYHPFDFGRLDFAGGTTFSDVVLDRGKHWSERLAHEAIYLAGLPKPARDSFFRRMELIDYARACALTGFNDLIKEDPRINLSGRFYKIEDTVATPFDFSHFSGGQDSDGRADGQNPARYAFEALLLRYTPAKVIREVLGHPTGTLSLAEMDEHLLGKKGFLTDKLKDAMKRGNAAKGVILKSKHIPMHIAPIMQAFEEYLFEKGRKFKGYSLEFVNNSDYRTVAIVFDTPKYYSRDDAKDAKDLSMRIVFDDNFGLPYIMYKNFRPESYEGTKPLGARSPTWLVNFHSGKDRHGDVKRFYETDWRTGKPCLCTIREPSPAILARAAEIAYRTQNGRKISPGELRGWYVDEFRKRRE